MRRTRIIIVDDHEIVCKGLSYILNNDRTEVVGIAHDGLEAIRLAQRLAPDLIIMDISMPLLNGIEATYQVRTFNKDVKIIVMSGYSDPEYIRRALVAGVNGYILKSMRAEMLLQAVETVIDSGKYFGDEIRTQIEAHKLDQPTEDPLASLSAREREVFFAMLEGMTIKETASKLALSSKTVETYRSRVMAKLGADNFASLLKFAVGRGLMTVD